MIATRTGADTQTNVQACGHACKIHTQNERYKDMADTSVQDAQRKNECYRTGHRCTRQRRRQLTAMLMTLASLTVPATHEASGSDSQTRSPTPTSFTSRSLPNAATPFGVAIAENTAHVTTEMTAPLLFDASASHVRLPFANIGADGGLALAEALRGARGLQSLDVSCGAVTPAAMASIAPALGDHERVRTQQRSLSVCWRLRCLCCRLHRGLQLFRFVGWV